MCFNFVEMAANMNFGKHEEARDHARMQNAYFEQVCSVVIVATSQ